MLVIRQEQMAALGASLRGRFEAEMAVHLATFFPEPCASMTRDKLASFIRRTADKALGYGIDRERDVCKFLDVAAEFGQDFDHDPKLPWARDVLTDPLLVGQEKINRLVKAALETVEQSKPQ
jgi:hypothetical protein